MTCRRPLAILALLLALPLAACAGATGNAPSLAPRAIEKTADIDTPIAGPLPPADKSVDPALAARIAAIVAKADAGQAAFSTEQGKVAKTVERAKTQSVGSDGWVGAQTALSSLEAARSGVQDAAGELEALRREQPRPTEPDTVAMDEAGTRIDALLTAQSETIAALAQQLPQ